MDKLIIPKGCEIIGEVHGLVYPGDIEIREPFHARELTSREGSIVFDAGTADAELDRVSAAKSVSVVAGSLRTASLKADTLDLDVAALDASGDLEATLTFTLNTKGSVTFGNAACAEGDLTIEAGTLAGKTVRGGEVTLSFQNGNLKEIFGHKVVVNGDLACDRIVAEEMVQVVGGKIRIKNVTAPSFRADPSVTGIVMVATCEDVRAEGVRGFLHPSELEMLSGETSTPPPGVIRTTELEPIETDDPVVDIREEEPVELTSADLDEEEANELEVVPAVVPPREDALPEIGSAEDMLTDEDEIADPFADDEELPPIEEIDDDFDATTADLPSQDEEAITAEPIQVNTDDFTNMETFDEPPAENDDDVFETVEEITTVDPESEDEDDDLYAGEPEVLDDILEEEVEELPEDFEDELPDELETELPDEFDAELPDELDAELPDELDAELPEELEAELPDDPEEVSVDDPAEVLDEADMLEPVEEEDDEDQLVQKLNEILDNIKAFFPDENYPQSIDQIRGYVANGQLNLFRRARNRESVIKNFQKFQHTEIDQLIEHFFEILDTYFGNEE